PSGAIRRFSTAGTKDSSSGRAIVSEPFGARRLHLRRQPGMALEEPDAGVPAQHRVVVARRAQRLRFLVVVQRFEDPAGGVARMSRQMLSASCGSLSSRYRSTLESARGIASLEIGLSCCMTPPDQVLGLRMRKSFRNGSYISSTTRSLSGMIALSVMLISSGQ